MLSVERVRSRKRYLWISAVRFSMLCIGCRIFLSPLPHPIRGMMHAYECRLGKTTAVFHFQEKSCELAQNQLQILRPSMSWYTAGSRL